MNQLHRNNCVKTTCKLTVFPSVVVTVAENRQMLGAANNLSFVSTSQPVFPAKVPTSQMVKIDLVKANLCTACHDEMVHKFCTLS